MSERPRDTRMIVEALEELELKPGASIDDVKRSFRALAAKWHPDKHDGDRRAERAMKGLNSACETLLKHGTQPDDVASTPSRPPPASRAEAASGRGCAESGCHTLAEFVAPDGNKRYCWEHGLLRLSWQELARAMAAKIDREVASGPTADDEPLCKATVEGDSCAYRALPGNYGYCGRHRKKKRR